MMVTMAGGMEDGEAVGRVAWWGVGPRNVQGPSVCVLSRSIRLPLKPMLQNQDLPKQYGILICPLYLHKILFILCSLYTSLVFLWINERLFMDYRFLIIFL